MRRCLLPLALLLAAPLAQALQMDLTRPELCELSHQVVVGEVTDLETRWTDEVGGGIERVVHVAVADRIKGGRGDGDSVEVVLPGGEIDGLGHWVEDVPRLLVNGRYLLFLAPALDGTLQVIGGDFGAVRITPEGSRIGETLDKATASVEVCRVAT